MPLFRYTGMGRPLKRRESQKTCLKKTATETFAELQRSWVTKKGQVNRVQPFSLILKIEGLFLWPLNILGGAEKIMKGACCFSSKVMKKK